MKRLNNIIIFALIALMVLTFSACTAKNESFELTVLVDASEGCTVVSDPSFKVEYGAFANITLELDEGYSIVKVLSDGEIITEYTYNDGALSVGPITSSQTIGIVAELVHEPESENSTEEALLSEEITSEEMTTEEITASEDTTSAEAETTVEKVTTEAETASEEAVTAEKITTVEEVTTTEETTTPEEVTATEEVTTAEEVITKTYDTVTKIPTGGKLPAGKKAPSQKSIDIVYYPNGGVAVKGAESYTYNYSLDRYTMVNTLPDNDTFARNGYVLVGYSTQPEGGEIVGMGHKMAIPEGAKKLELYCQWEKAAELDKLDYKKLSNGTIRINSYSGDESRVCIPKAIDDIPVTIIATGCFKSDTLTSVYLPSTITKVSGGAFECPNLEKVTMFDSVTSITGDSFSGHSIKTLDLNLATFPRYSSHSSGYARKYERLMCSDKPCVVVVAGSSIHYGLDSTLAEKLLNGKYTVVNAGISAQTNTVLELEALTPYIDGDDIVVYAPEQYAENTYHTSGNPDMSDLTFRIYEFDYKLIANVDLRNYTNVFENYSKYATQRLKLKEQYFETFSKYVDPIGDCGDIPDGPNSDDYIKGTNGIFKFCDDFFIEEHIHNMNRAIDALKAKGATVYFSHPTYNQNACDSKYLNDESYDAYHAYLSEVLHAELISDVRDYIYKGRYFSNTDYHSNKMGREKYTKKLVADIIAAQKGD